MFDRDKVYLVWQVCLKFFEGSGKNVLFSYLQLFGRVGWGIGLRIEKEFFLFLRWFILEKVGLGLEYYFLDLEIEYQKILLQLGR